MDHKPTEDITLGDLTIDAREIDLYPGITEAMNTEADFGDLFKTSMQQNNVQQNNVGREGDYLTIEAKGNLGLVNWPQEPEMKDKLVEQGNTVGNFILPNPKGGKDYTMHQHPWNEPSGSYLSNEDILCTDKVDEHNKRCSIAEGIGKLTHNSTTDRETQHDPNKDGDGLEKKVQISGAVKKPRRGEDYGDWTKKTFRYCTIDVPFDNPELEKKRLRCHAKKRERERKRREHTTCLEENVVAKKTMLYLSRRITELEDQLTKAQRLKASLEICPKCGHIAGE